MSANAAGITVLLATQAFYVVKVITVMEPYKASDAMLVLISLPLSLSLSLSSPLLLDRYTCVAGSLEFCVDLRLTRRVGLPYPGESTRISLICCWD